MQSIEGEPNQVDLKSPSLQSDDGSEIQSLPAHSGINSNTNNTTVIPFVYFDWWIYSRTTIFHFSGHFLLFSNEKLIV